jgi:hypothetical protein
MENQLERWWQSRPRGRRKPDRSMSLQVRVVTALALLCWRRDDEDSAISPLTPQIQTLNGACRTAVLRHFRTHAPQQKISKSHDGGIVAEPSSESAVVGSGPYSVAMLPKYHSQWRQIALAESSNKNCNITAGSDRGDHARLYHDRGFARLCNVRPRLYGKDAGSNIRRLQLHRRLLRTRSRLGTLSTQRHA